MVRSRRKSGGQPGGPDPRAGQPEQPEFSPPHPPKFDAFGSGISRSQMDAPVDASSGFDELESLYQEGEHSLRQGDRLDARRRFEELVDRTWPSRGGNPPAQVHLALALTQLGRMSDTRDGARVAQRAYTLAATAWTAISNAAARRGDSHQASLAAAEADRARSAAIGASKSAAANLRKLDRLCAADEGHPGLGSIGRA